MSRTKTSRKENKNSKLLSCNGSISKWEIFCIIFLFFVLLWCSGLMEILKKGTVDILIALVISSFALTSVVLQLHEKSGKTNRKGDKIIILFNWFMLGGLLMATGFLLPFISLVNNTFLFFFICTLTTAGISFFLTGCIILMCKIRDDLKKRGISTSL